MMSQIASEMEKTISEAVWLVWRPGPICDQEFRVITKYVTQVL